MVRAKRSGRGTGVRARVRRRALSLDSERRMRGLRALRPRAAPARPVHRCRATAASPADVVPPPLTAAALAASARLARLAGAAYQADDAALAVKLESEGAKLVACGSSYYTRWYVAAQGSTGARVVGIRGVTWTAPGPDSLRTARAMANAWPAPLAAGGRVLAHAGVGELAKELAATLRPHLRAAPAGATLDLTGHSLGGALAVTLAALLVDAGDVAPGGVRVAAFGAPPTLAPARDAPPPLAALGMPADAVLAFIAAGDPVPRWLAASDPSFAAAAALPPLAGLLRLRELLGAETLTQSRFLFSQGQVGRTHLLTWSPDEGHAARPLAPAAVDAALAAAAPDAAAAPGGGGTLRRALGFLLDHAHTSYADDLAAAAATAARREEAVPGGRA
jgi:hypothetical protein